MLILALNVFQVIFKTSLENTQNKTTVIYLLFAAICYFSIKSVWITKFLSIKCLVFTTIRAVLKCQWKIQRQIQNCSLEYYSSMLSFGQLCFTVVLFCLVAFILFISVALVYILLKIFWLISRRHHINIKVLNWWV